MVISNPALVVLEDTRGGLLRRVKHLCRIGRNTSVIAHPVMDEAMEIVAPVADAKAELLAVAEQLEPALVAASPAVPPPPFDVQAREIVQQYVLVQVRDGQSHRRSPPPGAETRGASTNSRRCRPFTCSRRRCRTVAHRGCSRISTAPPSCRAPPRRHQFQRQQLRRHRRSMENSTIGRRFQRQRQRQVQWCKKAISSAYKGDMLVWQRPLLSIVMQPICEMLQDQAFRIACQ